MGERRAKAEAAGDAMPATHPGDFETILSHCITRGRRKFVEVAENFPAPCRHVIDSLARLYRNDAHCKERNMTGMQRLDHHRGNSAALMLRLHIWMYKQLAHKQVEPNSGLGQALRYMLKHWPALTLFPRVPGAPQDNNICELALKKAICHRKNSLFYRSERGAELGDIYMSLIFTCQSCGANPFSYLQALQQHATAVALAPRRWLPWNYLAALPSGASALAHRAARSARHGGGTPARVGSPPISSTCSSNASSVRAGIVPSGQKANLPLDKRFWQSQKPLPS